MQCVHVSIERIQLGRSLIDVMPTLDQNGVLNVSNILQARHWSKCMLMRMTAVYEQCYVVASYRQSAVRHSLFWL